MHNLNSNLIFSVIFPVPRLVENEENDNKIIPNVEHSENFSEEMYGNKDDIFNGNSIEETLSAATPEASPLKANLTLEQMNSDFMKHQTTGDFFESEVVQYHDLSCDDLLFHE